MKVKITEKGIDHKGTMLEIGQIIEIGDHLPAYLINKCAPVPHGKVFVVNPEPAPEPESEIKDTPKRGRPRKSKDT